jgi:hypothetical protein
MNKIASKEDLLQLWRRYNYGLGPFIVFGLIVSRTVQVFSRVTGTERPIWTYATGLGIAAEIFYCWFYAKAHGNSDLVPFELIVIAQILFLTLGLVIRLVFAWKGFGPTSFPASGKALLYEDCKNEIAAQIAADTTTALVLIVGLHMAGSPILAGWFQLALCWLLACHAFGMAQSPNPIRPSRFHFDSLN